MDQQAARYLFSSSPWTSRAVCGVPGFAFNSANGSRLVPGLEAFAAGISIAKASASRDLGLFPVGLPWFHARASVSLESLVVECNLGLEATSAWLATAMVVDL